MFLIKYLLKPSKINGIGLFVNQDIPKDDVIHRSILSNDLLLDEKEFIRLSDDQKSTMRRFGYFDKYLKKWRLEAGDIKFCNHSKAPNVTLINTELVALRDISSGEEILHDYEEIEDLRTL